MTWKDITIEKFNQIQAVNAVEKEPFERTLATLAVIKGVKKKELDSIPINELQKELKELAFLSKPLSEKIHINFKVDGRTFRSCTDITKISTGQYVDLMHFAKQEPMSHIHDMMSVLCDEMNGSWFNKKKVAYSGDVQKERAELFYKHLSIDIAYPQALFFCNVLKNLMPAMQTYLKKEKVKLIMQLQILMRSIGDGTLPSTSLAKATG